MGLWRLKRLLTAQEGSYECLTCGATFEQRRQVCPECDGYDIRRVEWLDSR